MRPVKGDGARPSRRRRQQVVHAELVVEHPASLVGGGEIRNHLIFDRVRGRGSTRRIELFCEEGMVWLDDEFRGPLHIQTSSETEVRACPSPQWVDELSLADDEVGLAVKSPAMRRSIVR